MLPTPGCCRYCRCTEETPCKLRTGDACAWVDNDRTVCSNPHCLRKHARLVRRAARQEEARRARKLRRWLER